MNKKCAVYSEFNGCLEKIAETFETTWIKLHAEVGEVPMLADILDKTESLRIDLIGCPPGNTKATHPTMMGSITDRVMHAAHVPVSYPVHFSYFHPQSAHRESCTSIYAAISEVRQTISGSNQIRLLIPISPPALRPGTPLKIKE